MTSKSKTSETQDEYNEEQRRQVVAEAFGPVIDDILSERRDGVVSQDTDKTSTSWPKFGLPFHQQN